MRYTTPMKIYHLSHTDLDGYGCQYVVKAAGLESVCFNSGYGAEIDARLDEMARTMRSETKSTPILWLLTDLNLTAAQCVTLETHLSKLLAEGRDVKIQLLDHHVTGEEQAKNYSWYELDSSRCATVITFDYVKTHFPFPFDTLMEALVRHINAVDIWLSDTDDFECGKVLMRLISDSREINKLIFPTESVAYKMTLLSLAKEYLDPENPHYNERHIRLDDAIHFLKKEFLKHEQNDTLENLTAHYIVNLIGEKKEKMCVSYNGHRGILTSHISNSSVIGNAVLMAYPEFDFFMDYSGKGNISLRASGKCDVSQMAKSLFGGGGHKNASGGRLQGGKEFYVYADLRDFIQNILEPKVKGGA